VLYAHSLQGRPESEWEPLDKHLREVAELAAGFASVFGAAEWGRLAGLWHDLGKHRPEFQDRLRGSSRSVEHAGAGAALAFSVDRTAGLPLAFAIAGHHAGLADLQPGGGTGPRALTERLADNKPVLDALLPSLTPELTALSIPALPLAGGRELARSLEMWTRFLFSCLVDADYLATEGFYSPGSRAASRAGMEDLPTLRQRLDEALDALAAGLPPDRRDAPVNRRRAEILSACRAAAERPPGLFSLTVPTGGGKTFSSMAFALRHAEVHGLRRVVVAIPFTSIIEQNAAVYRRALADANVIEHHSAFDATAAEEADRGAEIRRRLAAENWDAPVVVTTNVQLFESLFAASPSRCRKLHNLAGSVILLDEAQTLPVEYLLPVLDSLRELTSRFGCTVVLMTATQPALERRDTLPQGLEGLHEIIPDPPALARDLSRVRVSWPDPDAPPRSYADLAREVASHERVLAVVHRRDDARLLGGLLPEEGRFHLSALMCAAHRSEVLGRVMKALGEGRPCRLVATQLVEAGVDVDFPVVYRCLGGLDSLAQAAGRCNREGRMPDKGSVVFFLAETRPPSGLPRKGLDEVQAMLRAAGGSGIDLDDPRVYDEYFRGLYSRCEPDPKGIQPLREGLSFHSVARKLRLIEDATTPVVVPWGAAGERLDALRRLGPDRLRLRALQPFVVNLYAISVSKLQKVGALEEVVEGVLSLAPPFHGLYDEAFGLVVEDEPRPDPERLIV
jgi:CRISPR-associated endonuclease/helicase Cas3